MSLKDMIARDIHGVFLSDLEFAEKRSVRFDGCSFANIPVILRGIRNRERRQLQNDHLQGLYASIAIFHCARADLDGKLPKVGQRFEISRAQDSSIYDPYYVKTAGDEMGLLRLELEEVNE